MEFPYRPRTAGACNTPSSATNVATMSFMTPPSTHSSAYLYRRRCVDARMDTLSSREGFQRNFHAARSAPVVRFSRDSEMSARVFVACSVLVAGLLTAACSGSDGVTTPTTANPQDSATSSQPRREPPPVRPPLPPTSGTCNAASAQSVIGEKASQELLERARRAAEASTARFIRPNEPITTESPAERAGPRARGELRMT
jgi:hypothetical protein